jgi:hypothetical protein
VVGIYEIRCEFWGYPVHYSSDDADDVGEPSGDPSMPLINFKKEGLFDPTQPLFPDMIAGNYEEWTVYNRSFSTHPWHLHQNHVLITKINGVTLPLPEWHDTLLVPAARCGTPLTPQRMTQEGTGDPAGAQPRNGLPIPTPVLGRPSRHQSGNAGSIPFLVYFNRSRGLLCRALPCPRP